MKVFGQKEPRNVAIFIFDEVDVLDFAGPHEVFTLASVRFRPGAFAVMTVGKEKGPVRARGNLTVTPNFGFASCPPADVLIIPGGPGVDDLLDDPEVLDWVGKQAARCTRVLSVCNGAVLLAKCGLLDGLSATTHFSDMAQLKAFAPRTKLEHKARYVDNGKIVTSAGISSGIDMCLHLVGELADPRTARETAHWMEYAPTDLPSQA